MRRRARRRLSLAALAAAIGLWPAAPAAADVTYTSLDGASPSFGVVGVSDVVMPAPGRAVPQIALPGGALGLFGFGSDDLDALSFGAPNSPASPLLFSVDRASAGGRGFVLIEATNGQAAGDTFVSAGGGLNFLIENQRTLGLLPPIPPGTPAVAPIDEVDALEINGGPVPAQPFFSIRAPNAHGVSGADVLQPGPSVAIPASQLGLTPGDEIDALHVDGSNMDVYFSLALGSPSLPAGGSPADVYVARGGTAPFAIFLSAAGLGLLATDDVDGITIPADSDADGLPDHADNCVLAPNVAQIDTDGDGCGNACDADYDQSLWVGPRDLRIFLPTFLLCLGQAGYNPLVDSDGDSCILLPDWAFFLASWNAAPGPGTVCP